MKINEVYSLINDYAPFSLSDEFVKLENGYDNSGIILPLTSDVTGVLFTLDLTVQSVLKAIEEKVNLIVTHHPAIYAPITSIKEGSALHLALANNIGVISAHLNLDVCEKGIDYYLASGLTGSQQEIITKLSLPNTGYGRTFNFNGTSGELKALYEKTFESDKTALYGNPNAKIQKVAVFCGSGLSESEIEKEPNADIYLSADVKHHIILALTESGKQVLEVNHYSSEVYGFKKFYEELKLKLNGIKAVFFENEIML